MATKWMFYDASGVLRNVIRPMFYDSGGVLRTVKEGWFYDAAGVLRKFFGSVVGASCVFLPALSKKNNTATTWFQWTVPAGVTLIHVAMVGGGGSGSAKTTAPKGCGGSGGGFLYSNDITVTPGEVLRISPGGGGIGRTGSTAAAGEAGQSSSLQRGAGTNMLVANAGNLGSLTAGGAAAGGTISQGTGIVGLSGAGGTGGSTSGGGGGAGGYSGNGGAGGGVTANGAAGAGGAGGGGASSSTNTGAQRAGQGGGTGVFGVGSPGAGGVYTAGVTNAPAAEAKSGSEGIDPPLNIAPFVDTQTGAGLWGGGGAGANINTGIYSGQGGMGAICVRWGSSPKFPDLMLPPAQTHDFTARPVLAATFFTVAAMQVELVTDAARAYGTIGAWMPVLNRQAVLSALMYSTSDTTWQIAISGLAAPILDAADLATYLKRITVDTLGFLDVSAANAPSILDYSAAKGVQYIKWPGATMPIWSTATTYTARVTY